MADGCGPKCAKMMLIIFNVIFWLSGCALIAVGIWLIVDPNVVKVLNFVEVVSDGALLKYAAYVLIAIGGFVFIVGFLGCCGAIKESKVMLGIYIFLLFLVMAGELAGGILAIVYKDKILAEIDEKVLEAINDPAKKYDMAAADADKRDPFWQLMDFVQSEFKCCGLKQASTEYAQFKLRETTNNYPYGCYPLVEGQKPSQFFSANEVNLAGTPHPDGCAEAIKEEIESKAIILIGVGIGIACLEIFGIIFAICLCRGIGEEI